MYGCHLDAFQMLSFLSPLRRSICSLQLHQKTGFGKTYGCNAAFYLEFIGSWKMMHHVIQSIQSPFSIPASSFPRSRRLEAGDGVHIGQIANKKNPASSHLLLRSIEFISSLYMQDRVPGEHCEIVQFSFFLLFFIYLGSNFIGPPEQPAFRTHCHLLIITELRFKTQSYTCFNKATNIWTKKRVSFFISPVCLT